MVICIRFDQFKRWRKSEKLTMHLRCV